MPIIMRSIPGYEGEYSITRFGMVYGHPRSGNHFRGGWLKRAVDHKGYYRVRLYSNGKSKFVLVHRLVLLTWIGPCPKGLIGCHKNGDRTDNRVANLAWQSYATNARDSVRRGTARCCHQFGAANHATKLSDDQVREIRRRKHEPHKQLAKEFGVHYKHIGLIACRRKRSHVT